MLFDCSIEIKILLCIKIPITVKICCVRNSENMTFHNFQLFNEFLPLISLPWVMQGINNIFSTLCLTIQNVQSKCVHTQRLYTQKQYVTFKLLEDQNLGFRQILCIKMLKG